MARLGLPCGSTVQPRGEVALKNERLIVRAEARQDDTLLQKAYSSHAVIFCGCLAVTCRVDGRRCITWLATGNTSRDDYAMTFGRRFRITRT